MGKTMESNRPMPDVHHNAQTQTARLDAAAAAAAAETHPEKAAATAQIVPPARAARRRLIALAAQYVATEKLVPPLSITELEYHAQTVAQMSLLPPENLGFVTVLLNNALWEKTLAAVPYDRRVLLLPQCLRNPQRCAGQFDAFGLLCNQCGACPIGALQAEAEALGYVVLVAEGTTVVTTLLEQGQVDAVVGVSCLSVLKRAFPHMAADAIPGIAIPLLRDGCVDTMVDLEWVRTVLRLKSEQGWTGRIELDELHDEVRGWFEPVKLRALLDTGATETEQLAIDWLAKCGKRWRPFFAVATYKALTGTTGPVPAYVRAAAVAVECFHKASLIHDDIEDEDDCRYGSKTLHCEYGVPVALNTGDLLLGEGYRLIAQSAASAECTARLAMVAAEGHRSLCLGQGLELSWSRQPVPLTVARVLDIFRLKTAPAFEVALRLGAVCAGADSATEGVLKRYSEALGIAYQIRDDIEDSEETGGDGTAVPARLSILAALAAADPGEPQAGNDAGTPEARARMLLEHYRNEAVRSLAPLQHAYLKTFLRRIIGRVLH